MSAGVGRSTQTSELVLSATNQTDRAFREVAGNADKLRQAFDRQAASQSVLFQRAAGGVAGLERRLTAATAAMGFGEVLRESVVEFAAMDRRITRLSQNAERSKGVVQDMKSELVKLANETGQSIESVFSGFETYVQQTGDYKQAADNIRNIVIANQALGAEMKDTAQTARVLNDNLKFKAGDETYEAFNIFAAAAQNGKFEAKNFAQYMPVLAQSMEQAGLKGKRGLAQMAAIMEVIARKSPDNERAVLGFRDVINKMFTQETENHFNNAGATITGQLNKTLKEGGDVLATAASTTRRTLENIALRETGDKSKYMSFVSRLFPEEDSRRGIVALMEYFDQIGPLMKNILESGDLIKKNYEEVRRDATSEIERIGNKWGELKNQIGKSLIKVGVLDGMDKFAKDVDDVISGIERVGNSLDRIRKNPLRIFSEVGGGVIGYVHGEMERVSRLNLEQAEKNAAKARVKAQRARDAGQPVTGDRLEAEAQREDQRAKRLRYQLKHGLSYNRVFGNSEEGEGPAGPERLAEGLAGSPSGTADTRAVPAPGAAQRVMPDELQRSQDRLDAMREEVEALRRASDELRGVRDAYGRGQRMDAPPADSGMAPNPGGFNPYAPQPGQPGFSPSSSAEDWRSMIQKSNVVERTGLTSDTSGPTARGQSEEIRLSEQTNALLRALIANARYGRNTGYGDDEGAGAGGAGGSGGSESGGSGSGGGGGGGFGASGGRGYRGGGGGGSGGTGRRPGIAGGTPSPGGGQGQDPQGTGEGNRGPAGTGKMMAVAMDQLRREGVPEERLREAAGHLVGQATMESGLDPNKSHDNSTGYGLYGARDPSPGRGRRTDMLKWMKANGYAPNSAEGQMRYMAKEAMSGQYPRTRSVLMGNGTGNVEADTNTITKEFESPRVVNRRSGAVRNAMRVGPEADGATASGGDTPGSGAGGGVAQRQQGGIRNQPITSALQDQLSRAGKDAGVDAEVYSGGQDDHGPNRTGSHRHDHGKSADVKLYATDADGKRRLLSMNNPADRARMQKFIERSVAHGATGVGAGPGYMGEHGIHIGGGSPLAWGAGGKAANAPQWVRDAHEKGMADQGATMAQDRAGAATAAPAPAPAPAAPSATMHNAAADIEAQTQALERHRAMAEKPIRLSYQSDGLGRGNTSSESVHLRRATDASMRASRQNSFADTGVA